MTFLSGEFFCFCCQKHKPIALREEESQSTKPQCKACKEKFDAKQTTKARAITRRKINRTKRIYAADGARLTETIKYLTKGGG